MRFPRATLPGLLLVACALAAGGQALAQDPGSAARHLLRRNAPFDPSIVAEWLCYPAFGGLAPASSPLGFDRAGLGACGCAYPGSCGDRAPAGCYCDERCVEEGDCCPDAGVCVVNGGDDGS